MPLQDIETFCPASPQEWRQWLEENHCSKSSVWLVYYRKATAKPSISWSQAVDEALCFGWIDSTKKSVDSETYIQFFCKRKPKSIWSKINKEKVERLIKDGLMTKAGMDSIETAKENGSWTLSDGAEELQIPKDLTEALEILPGAAQFFLSLSKSVRKGMLHWVAFAKRPETRQQRITEIATLAALGRKPKQF